MAMDEVERSAMGKLMHANADARYLAAWEAAGVTPSKELRDLCLQRNCDAMAVAEDIVDAPTQRMRQ